MVLLLTFEPSGDIQVTEEHIKIVFRVLLENEFSTNATCDSEPFISVA